SKDTEETIHHSKFWFSDGSFVLRIENTLFRVHRSILCVNSEVFTGMLEIPQPEDIENVDGCPYVELQDSLQDFEAFMMVLYNPLWWDQTNSTLENQLSFAISILRISNKYGCHTLRKKAISILKEHIPTDISGHEKVLKLKHLSRYIIARLLSVARETNLKIFLPVAYLIWATGHPSQIIELMHNMGNDKAPWDDAAICLAGRAELLTIQGNVYKVGTNFQPPDNCLNTCRPLSFIITTALVTNLDGYTKWSDAWGKSSGFCENCIANAKRMFEEGQAKLWDAIPEAFELESWEALKLEAQDFE
ncbi:hypothetical protein BDQ17DRAFT_1256360, partial [Cyathus striatus]